MSEEHLKELKENEIDSFLEKTKTKWPYGTVLIVAEKNNKNVEIGLGFIRTNAAKFAGQVNCAYTYLEDNEDLKTKLRVKKIPTFIVYYRGEEIYRKEGAPLSNTIMIYDISRKIAMAVKKERKEQASISHFF